MTVPVGQNYLPSEFGFCVGFFRICAAKLSLHVTRDLKIIYSKMAKNIYIEHIPPLRGDPATSLGQYTIVVGVTACWGKCRVHRMMIGGA